MDSPFYSGKIHMVIGPMFSGKTTEMFRLINRYQYSGKSSIVIRYENDTRYEQKGKRKILASSHDFKQMEALAVKDLLKIDKLILGDKDVIGIDEAQFMLHLEEFCEEMTRLNKIIIISALDSDFKRNAFPNIVNLIPKAETVEKLQAVCVLCAFDASFTRKIAGETGGQTIEDIGGAEKYISVCRPCYFKKDIDFKKLDKHRDNLKRSRKK